MQVSKYTFLVSHDGGKFRLSTMATSEQAAKDIICNYEGCPESAIHLIRAYAGFMVLKEILT